MKRGLLLPLLFLAVACVSACAGKWARVEGPLSDAELKERFVEKATTQRPAFIKQRVIVHAGGKQYAMIGYLKLRADGTWTAVVLDDMGVELFRFGNVGEGPEVLASVPNFPPNPLEDVPGDIDHLYGGVRREECRLFRAMEGRYLLVENADKETREEFLFSPSGDLVYSRTIEDGRATREGEE